MAARLMTGDDFEDTFAEELEMMQGLEREEQGEDRNGLL